MFTIIELKYINSSLAGGVFNYRLNTCISNPALLYTLTIQYYYLFHKIRSISYSYYCVYYKTKH